MKYLLLYEAFGSVSFSKTVNFLKDKFSLPISKAFISVVKQMMTVYDLPLSQITDNNIEYLSKRRSLKIRPEDPVKNKWGIYCLKFWFSLEQGYLGFTGTGNTMVEFDSWVKAKLSVQKEVFNKEELEYIKNTLGITTGILVPVTDYSRLQLGDEVIGYFGKARDKEFLTKAKIWIDEKHLKAIQNVAKGKDPKKEVNGELSWRSWGDFSWGIGKPENPAPDHLLLHHYIPNAEPLKIVSGKGHNPLDFNLPVRNNGTVSNWSEPSSIGNFKVLDAADFAIILYVDNMIETIPSAKEIKGKRIDIKKGAIKFMKDEEIKNINIKRYLSGIIAGMGIKKDIGELHNLQKVFLRSLCGHYAFISLFKNDRYSDYLFAFIDAVRRLLLASKGTAGVRLSEAVDIFDSLNKDSSMYRDLYDKSWKIMNKSGTPQQKEIAQLIYIIGLKIRDYLVSQDVQTFEDLKIIYHKIKSLRSFIQDSDFHLSSQLGYIFGEFHQPQRTIIHCREFAGIDYSIDIEKLRYVEKYVDSIIK